MAEIIQHGIDNLAAITDPVDADVLLEELYNMDYFIIGIREAKEFLNRYGTFDAIARVKDYESEHLGQVYTDLSDPEKVANMLAYIEGETILEKCPTYARIRGNTNKLREEHLEGIKDELQKMLN